MADEEFSTVQDGAVVNGIGTVLVVLFILWMALHSAKIITAVFINLFIGLSITTAAGLWMVGSFNLLSVAFAVLFVGLGVDFGIQFSVRYRSERYKNDDLQAALASAAPNTSRCRCRWPRWRPRPGSCRSCRPITRACRNSARSPASACWWRFSPASRCCRRCSSLFNPPGEKEAVGYAFLAPVDHFLEKHRVIIIVGTLVIAVAGLPLLYFLKFDFNPINLRSNKVEFDLDLSRSAERPQHRRQRHQRDDEFGRGCAQDRSQAGKSAGSAARDVAGKLRAGRPAGQTEADRRRRQGAQSRAQPGFDRCGALRPGEYRLAEGIRREPAQDRRRQQGSRRGGVAAAGGCAGKTRRVQSGDARQGAGDLRRSAEDRARPAQNCRCRRSRSA